MGIILVSVSEILATPLSSELKSIAQCSSTPDHASQYDVPQCFQNSTIHSNSTGGDDEANDQRHTVWLFAILVSIVFVFFVFVFRPKYQRVDSERRASFEQSTYVGTLNS